MGKVPNFIEHRYKPGLRIGSKSIAITRNGALSIYAGFYLSNKLKNFSKCLLLFDKEQKIIGLQFGNEELGEGTYSLVHDKEYKTASINTSSFFTINSLNVDDWHGRYEPEIINNSQRPNLFMIDYEKKTAIYRKPKS